MFLSTLLHRKPGNKVSVQIGGLTSMPSFPPLIVIDGLPTNNFNPRGIDPGSRLVIQNDHQISLLNGTDKAKTMFSINFFENRGTQTP